MVGTSLVRQEMVGTRVMARDGAKERPGKFGSTSDDLADLVLATVRKRWCKVKVTFRCGIMGHGPKGNHRRTMAPNLPGFPPQYRAKSFRTPAPTAPPHHTHIPL